jgi:uncharacterized membrane protein YbhN (UPF0104 family)
MSITFQRVGSTLGYKYSLPLQFSHSFSGPQATKILLLSVFGEFSMLTVMRFLKFRFKEVTSLSLFHFYVVMLLKYCLILLVLALGKLCFKSC